MTKAAWAKKISDCSERLHTGRDAFRKIHWDSRIGGMSQKAQNSKAICCTLLKRITKFKCVNSEVKSVDIHPKQGCLTWPYGTTPGPP